MELSLMEAVILIIAHRDAGDKDAAHLLIDQILSSLDGGHTIIQKMVEREICTVKELVKLRELFGDIQNSIKSEQSLSLLLREFICGICLPLRVVMFTFESSLFCEGGHQKTEVV